MNTNWVIGMVLLVPGLYFLFIDKEYDFIGLVLAAVGVIELVMAADRHERRGSRK
jgi:hypothetical protein